jgi:hypothetical protein
MDARISSHGLRLEKICKRAAVSSEEVEGTDADVRSEIDDRSNLLIAFVVLAAKNLRNREHVVVRINHRTEHTKRSPYWHHHRIPPRLKKVPEKAIEGTFVLEKAVFQGAVVSRPTESLCHRLQGPVSKHLIGPPCCEIQSVAGVGY